MSSPTKQTSSESRSTRSKTTREFIAETVKKAVQVQIDQGRMIGPTVLERMLKNADNAWARHCQRVGIDLDTPLNSAPLPDDGSATEFQRAGWCYLPKEQDRKNAVFICRHGKVHSMQQEPSIQEASGACSQSAAMNDEGASKGKKLKNVRPSGSRGPYSKKGTMAERDEYA